MGWTYYDRPPADVRAEMDSVYGGPAAVLRSAIVDSVYYCAYTRPSGDVCAGVALLEVGRGTFGYKDMTEHMGPYQYGCPASVLDILTEPAPGPYAAQWRERCRANLAGEVAA